MHRFYAFHSFTHFHRNGIAAASLFLAAKVEEQPRKLEHVIKVVNASLNEDITKDSYLEQAQDLVFNENVLLQTLGFDVAIDHPHTHVVKTCHLVKGALTFVFCLSLSLFQYLTAASSFVPFPTHHGSWQGLGADLVLHGQQQPPPHHHVPAVQANRRRLLLHPPGVQVVQLGGE